MCLSRQSSVVSTSSLMILTGRVRLSGLETVRPHLSSTSHVISKSRCIFTLHANRDVYDSYIKQKLISHFAKHVFTILSACLGISDVLCITVHCGIPKPFQVFLMKLFLIIMFLIF